MVFGWVACPATLRFSANGIRQGAKPERGPYLDHSDHSKVNDICSLCRDMVRRFCLAQLLRFFEKFVVHPAHRQGQRQARIVSEVQPPREPFREAWKSEDVPTHLRCDNGGFTEVGSWPVGVTSKRARARLRSRKLRLLRPDRELLPDRSSPRVQDSIVCSARSLTMAARWIVTEDEMRSTTLPTSGA